MLESPPNQSQTQLRLLWINAASDKRQQKIVENGGRDRARSTIKGSQPAFASGDVVDVADATDIRSITEWHWLSPSSVIRTAIGASCEAGCSLEVLRRGLRRHLENEL
jgi:hypothetical protein